MLREPCVLFPEEGLGEWLLASLLLRRVVGLARSEETDIDGEFLVMIL